MKIEFIPNVNGHGEHVIRIFHFDQKEAVLLKQVFEKIIEEGRTIPLDEFEFIEHVNCNLSLRIGGYDEGIITKDDHNFFLKMCVAGYQSMIKTMEPFCNKESRGYVWLYDLDNPIDLLFSAGYALPDYEDFEDKFDLD